MKVISEKFPVDISKTLFKNFTEADWALYYIERYGQIDGEHHKAWVLDQIARILLGTKVIVTEARWESHPPELRVNLYIPHPDYKLWVEAMGGEEYDYDEGIAP